MPAGTPDVPGAGDNPVGHLNDYGPQSFGMNFDPNNNLYVAELNRNRVLVYNQPFQSSPTVTPTATNTPTPTPTSSILSCGSSASWSVAQPYGVATDSFGNIYVVNNATNLVDVFNSSGVPLSPISAIGTGHLVSPIGVAVDGNGNVYVTDAVQSIYTVAKFNMRWMFLTV